MFFVSKSNNLADPAARQPGSQAAQPGNQATRIPDKQASSQADNQATRPLGTIQQGAPPGLLRAGGVTQSAELKPISNRVVTIQEHKAFDPQSMVRFGQTRCF